MFKKIMLRITALVFLVALAIPAISNNEAALVLPTKEVPGSTDPRVQQMVQRLEEIKGMDKSGLSSSEKRSLRKEVKSIKKEMKVVGGGVYLSVGALIIVILLLILLL